MDSDRPLVLVTGGSQGATGLNELVMGSLPMLAQRAPHWQWLHLAGSNDAQRVQQAYAAAGLKAVVQPFLGDMALALGAATAVVSRAGASSLAEIAAMRVPSLLVPFPHAADNHQFHNARAFAQTGAARLLEQARAKPAELVELLSDLVENPELRAPIQTALAAWHSPNAAEQIAETILAAVTRSRELEQSEMSERNRQAGRDHAPRRSSVLPEPVA